MPPKGKCRVCGAPSPGLPCYKCLGLMFNISNENLSDEVRAKAVEELEQRGRMEDGKMP